MPPVAPAPVATATPTAPGTTPPAKSAAEEFADQYDIHDSIPELPVKTSPQPPAASVPTVATTSPPAASSTPAAAAVSPPPAPKHPAWLLGKATDQGIHPVIIERLTTEELSQYVMDNMASILANRREGSIAQTIQSPQPNPQATPPVAAAATPTAAATPQLPPIDWGYVEEDGVKVKVEDKDIHESLVKVLKEQAARIAALEAANAKVVGHVVATQEQTLLQQFEDAFSKFPHILGVGDGASLKGKPEFERRRIIYNMVKGIPAEQRRDMTVEQAVSQAMKLIYNADPQGVAAAATPANGQTPQGDAWSQAVLAKPTQRHNGMPPGEARAKANAENYMREHAANGTASFGDTDLGEFLD